ncbi:hypothetical protein PVAP13_5KG555307 [Panicum virgatum]|uniref:Uncharacterized protein n=1 Tax=Panicum virgatum TaxID=38727 RepID=A0A8T0SRZ0_PANVG|nr:hypothetical protein PVAP13_5KG555307 [Panicum virgatum]
MTCIPDRIPDRPAAGGTSEHGREHGLIAKDNRKSAPAPARRFRESRPGSVAGQANQPCGGGHTYSYYETETAAAVTGETARRAAAARPPTSPEPPVNAHAAGVGARGGGALDDAIQSPRGPRLLPPPARPLLPLLLFRRPLPPPTPLRLFLLLPRSAPPLSLCFFFVTFGFGSALGDRRYATTASPA